MKKIAFKSPSPASHCRYAQKVPARTAHILIALFLALLTGACPQVSFAQCTAPTGAGILSAPANCPGEGKVIVDTVTGGPVGAVYQYQLQYDSTGNTSVVKPWQSADSFNQVAVGRYKVYIRQVCSTGFSAVYVSPSVTVAGNTTPLSIQQAFATGKSSCGNGSLKITATGGNTNSPYQYALVPTLNEPEPVSAYVRPKQASNSFTGLPAGTYYARVYDSCGSYASATVVVDSAAENVLLSTQNPNGYTFYGCDSIRFVYTVRVSNKLPVTPGNTVIPADPGERFWITYNGVTDTIPYLQSFIYSAALGVSTASVSKFIKVVSYPMTVTYGYKSTCGNFYSNTVTIAKPTLKIVLTSNSVSCTNLRYQIRTTDSVSANYNYVNTRLSLDSGATWSALNTGNLYLDTFTVGNTYSIWVASGCDTEKIIVTTVVPVLSMAINQFTAYSCNGMSGIHLSAFNYSGNADSIKFTVLSQPAGGTLPDSFYMRQLTNVNGATQGHNLTYNILPGAYSLKVTDQCGTSTTLNITINPTVVSYTISPLLSCLPSQSGFRLTLSETNYQPYAGYSYLRAIVTNTTTGQVDSFQSASQVSRPTTIDVTGLSDGQYTIKVIKVRPNTLPYPACSVDSVYVNTSNQPLSLGQTLFTSACNNGTATVAAQALGGGGGYQFSLDVQGGGGSWSLVAGPQSGNVFNNLSPVNVYRIRVTDVCGNGTLYSTSFSNASPALEYSSTMSPCPGSSFTMSVDPGAGAVYTWQKDGTTIAGATGNAYTLDPVPASGIDTYQLKIAHGNCDLFTNTFIVNPALCGVPLPVYVRSFSGILDAQDRGLLKWEAPAPEAIRLFDVEYSADGTSFRSVGTVIADGNRNYRYTDERRPGNQLFYRLKITGTDGKADYSGVIRLNRKGSTGAVQVYPTLVSDKINISYGAATAETLGWSLVDVQGRTVRGGTFAIDRGTAVLTITDLSALPGGTYVLVLNSSSGFRRHEKIVIGH